jgi:hypothetical protein
VTGEDKDKEVVNILQEKHMVDRMLTLQPTPDEQSLKALEQEAISLLEAINAAIIPGNWQPSPVEEKYQLVREALIRTPRVLRTFRRSFLAAGRLNWPDSPRPKEY